MESRLFAGGRIRRFFGRSAPLCLPKRRARRRIKKQAAKVTET